MVVILLVHPQLLSRTRQTFSHLGMYIIIHKSFHGMGGGEISHRENSRGAISSRKMRLHRAYSHFATNNHVERTTSKRISKNGRFSPRNGLSPHARGLFMILFWVREPAPPPPPYQSVTLIIDEYPPSFAYTLLKQPLLTFQVVSDSTTVARSLFSILTSFTIIVPLGLMQRLNPTGSLLRARPFVARHDYIFTLLCQLNINMGALNSSALVGGGDAGRPGGADVRIGGDEVQNDGVDSQGLCLDTVLAQGLLDDMAGVFQEVIQRSLSTLISEVLHGALDTQYSLVVGSK